MTEAALTTDPGVQGNTDAAPTEETTTDTGLMGEGTETKPETTNEGLMGDDKETAEETKPTGAPEQYEAFDVSAGEDIGYKLTDEQEKALSEFGKANGLSQEQMNGIIKYDIERQKAQIKADDEADKAEITEWQEQARKEHGDKYKDVLAGAKKVWDSTIVPKGFKTLLTATKLNYHPQVLNLFHNISKFISEDVFVPPEQRTKGKNEGGLDGMFSDLKNKKT